MLIRKVLVKIYTALIFARHCLRLFSYSNMIGNNLGYFSTRSRERERQTENRVRAKGEVRGCPDSTSSLMLFSCSVSWEESPVFP